MNPSMIIMLVTQLLPLVTSLATEISKAQGLSETDKEALEKAIRETKEKVAAIKWE